MKSNEARNTSPDLITAFSRLPASWSNQRRNDYKEAKTKNWGAAAAAARATPVYIRIYTPT